LLLCNRRPRSDVAWVTCKFGAEIKGEGNSTKHANIEAQCKPNFVRGLKFSIGDSSVPEART